MSVRADVMPSGSWAILGYRDLFWTLVGRELKARYKGSVLGFAWSMLNPLLMLAIYSLVFSQIMRAGPKDFAVFVFVGLLPWTWFQVGVMNATNSVIAHGGLIKKVCFPLEILPTVMVTTNFINYLLGLPILFGFLWATGHFSTTALLFLPVLLAIQFVLTWGLGTLLASANVYFRDVEQLLGVGMMAWFYLTPILYDMSMVPDRFKPWIGLNPMTNLVVGYHGILLHNSIPSLASLVCPATFAAGIAGIALLVFRRHKYSFHELV